MSDTRNTQQDGWIGQTLGREFRIRERLGGGGMGVVYLADQTSMGRTVVVKVMHKRLAADSTAVERFRREAQAIARLSHPNIIQVFSFGRTDDGALYFAMERVDGTPLSAVLRQAGRLPPAKALRIGEQIAGALAAAHASGVVHRDLKPDNIMLCRPAGSPDFVKVLDFGLAKLVGAAAPSQTLTHTGMVAGTPRYMAPEQAGGHPVTERTDIYSLGIILYEMLAGDHPFEAHSVRDYMVMHCTQPVPPIAARCPAAAVSAALDALVSKCLRKEPEARVASALELQAALRAELKLLPGEDTTLPIIVPRVADSDSETVAAEVPAGPQSTASASRDLEPRPEQAHTPQDRIILKDVPRKPPWKIDARQAIALLLSVAVLAFLGLLVLPKFWPRPTSELKTGSALPAARPAPPPAPAAPAHVLTPQTPVVAPQTPQGVVLKPAATAAPGQTPVPVQVRITPPPVPDKASAATPGSVPPPAPDKGAAAAAPPASPAVAAPPASPAVAAGASLPASAAGPVSAAWRSYKKGPLGEPLYPGAVRDDDHEVPLMIAYTVRARLEDVIAFYRWALGGVEGMSFMENVADGERNLIVSAVAAPADIRFLHLIVMPGDEDDETGTPVVEIAVQARPFFPD